MKSENNKIVEEGNVVKKDSLLSLSIFIDFFQIAVYIIIRQDTPLSFFL